MGSGSRKLRQHGLLRNFEQECVTACHRVKESVQLQILRQLGSAMGLVFLESKIPISIHEKGLHGVTCSLCIPGNPRPYSVVRELVFLCNGGRVGKPVGRLADQLESP